MPVTIGINDFVRRQTPDSDFTHYEGTLEQVVELTLEHFEEAAGSYHQDKGVILVPVPPQGFFTGVVRLEEGDELFGKYVPRRPGEEPRKTLRCVRKGAGKTPAVGVDIVLYKREVLEAGGSAVSGADWDIISINGRITEEEQPIEPMTLIANHYELDGGTATGMSPEKFEAALRESVLYWKDKAILDMGKK